MSIKMSNKISVVIITKNEQENIKDCLESVKWVDEIVIIDDCSSDNTVQICKDFGAKVVIHKSNSNFDQQRNLGIDNASSDWIMQMDADEVVPFDLKKEIIESINSSSEFVAYEFRRKNCFLGHFLTCDSGTYYIKLFRKGKARYIGESVHETLEIYGPIGKIQSYVEHYNFDSIFQFIQRQNFYTEREAKLMLESKSIGKKEIIYNLRKRPLKLFNKYYFKKKGYRDGFCGLVFASLMAVRHIMLWAKYWELVKDRYTYL